MEDHSVFPQNPGFNSNARAQVEALRILHNIYQTREEFLTLLQSKKLLTSDELTALTQAHEVQKTIRRVLAAHAGLSPDDFS